MRKSVKRTAVIGAVAAGLVLGGVGIAAASTGPEAKETETPVAGTIAAPADSADTETEGATEAEENAQDAAEAQALEALATTTAEEAEAAALGAAPGTVRFIELEEEDGFVVYEVKVEASDGTVTEVIIDAGNASVLAQELDDDDEDTGADEPADSKTGGNTPAG